MKKIIVLFFTLFPLIALANEPNNPTPKTLESGVYYSTKNPQCALAVVFSMEQVPIVKTNSFGQCAGKNMRFQCNGEMCISYYVGTNILLHILSNNSLMILDNQSSELFIKVTPN